MHTQMSNSFRMFCAMLCLAIAMGSLAGCQKKKHDIEPMDSDTGADSSTVEDSGSEGLNSNLEL